MTADLAIQAENLGKLFPAGGCRAPARLREAISESVRGALREAVSRVTGQEIPRPDAAEDATFWALRHVCFQVRRGKVLGILGGNGAGKTTLLRVLSRITLPTEGRAQIRGRVAALLDCGAALHGELTGRENVRLYGGLLGMSKRETEQKFGEIVCFAGLERAIDFPIKRYSTGMCLRLAFSVAAHLETEVLLVDDVLGAADMAFQKKCLEKMAATASKGGAVILVSHDPSHVRSFCTAGIVLAQGRVVYSGSAAEAADLYAANAGLCLPTGLVQQES